MKKFFVAAGMLASFNLLAATPVITNLTDKEVEDITNEFAMNFSHTSVNAPETDGAWGVEVGLIAGQTGSPKLKKKVSNSGGDGGDFDNLYHAGLMARAHFPYDIFLEATILPEREISDVDVKSRSFGLGWNFGEFFSLPVDLAVGANVSNSEIGFTQIQNTPAPNTRVDIDIESKTQVLWAGVSKSFWFFTPYAKIGTAKSDSTLKASGSNIFASASDKKDGESSGSYWAVGANLEFFFFKLGLETSSQADVKRTSAKFSLDF